MNLDTTDRTGCADLISLLLDGRSWLLYQGAEAESEAVRQLAAWLQSRRGLLDTTLVERIQQELTPGFIEALDTAHRELRDGDQVREAGAVGPFVSMFRGMLELRDACTQMHRSYEKLQAVCRQAA